MLTVHILDYCTLYSTQVQHITLHMRRFHLRFPSAAYVIGRGTCFRCMPNRRQVMTLSRENIPLLRKQISMMRLHAVVCNGATLFSLLLVHPNSCLLDSLHYYWANWAGLSISRSSDKRIYNIVTSAVVLIWADKRCGSWMMINCWLLAEIWVEDCPTLVTLVLALHSTMLANSMQHLPAQTQLVAWVVLDSDV